VHLQAEALARPSAVVEGEPRLDFDGAGLPTFLAHLATTDQPRLQELVEGVRTVVPSVEATRQMARRWDLPFAGEDGEPSAEMRYHLEVKMAGAWIPADLLSEGTLLAFGVQAILHQLRPPRLLLMDDIDRGLHPKAQRALVQQLKEAAQHVQIITSTHSPYILDELPPEAVRVVRAGENGTQVRSLTEHPEWQEWKSSMTSGEFWTYVGEEWLEQAE
jgi:predicted ATPase